VLVSVELSDVLKSCWKCFAIIMKSSHWHHKASWG